MNCNCSSNIITLNGDGLTVESVINISGNNYKVEFDEATIEKIKKFRNGLKNQVMKHPNDPVYGVNTGCGDLLSSWLMNRERVGFLNTKEKFNHDSDNEEVKKAFYIYSKALERYQAKYIKAHNCATGKPLPLEIVRAIMVIRLNSFAKGCSSVRWETCKMMIDMLNAGVTPWVLEEGSVGASGDLIPLAMIGASMMGLPEAKSYYKGELYSADEALKKAGISPVSLGPKEAMGLTNGSNFIAAFCVYAAYETQKLLKNTSISAALSLEAIRGEKNAFDKRIHDARPHKGQLVISRHIRTLLEDSGRTSREAQKIPFVYPFIIVEDIPDFKSFVDLLTNNDSRSLKFLHDSLDENIAKKIDKYSPDQSNQHQIKELLIEELNVLIDKRYFYNRAAFSEIQLSKEGELLRNQAEEEAGIDDLPVNQYRILNRIIMEEIFQGKLRKRDGLAQRIHYPAQAPETARPRIQDRYSFRAIPQVHGPLCEALEKFREVTEIEINSATDNPLVFPNEKDESGFDLLSAANFHGQPLAAVIDYLKATVTSLGLITDKRCFAMLDKHQSFGLPGDLGPDSTQSNTGLMITQYAGAARAADSRVLSTPASVMSVSTSANQEDFVSMGSIGAIHLMKVINNTQIITAVEMLCALRALQMTMDLLPKSCSHLGKGTEKVYKYLNNLFPETIEDRYLRTDMEKMIKVIQSGELLNLVEL